MSLAEVSTHKHTHIYTYAHMFVLFYLCLSHYQVAVKTCDVGEERSERHDFLELAQTMMSFAVPHHGNVLHACMH